MTLRKLAAAFAAVSMIAVLSGCYSTPVMPPAGVIFSGYDAPTSLSIGGQDLGSRRGTASCKSLLMLFAWGNCSAKAAADAGGITQIKQLDHSFINVLFFWQSLTMIAYGD